MLKFEILQELESNAEILDIIKDYDYAIKNGRIKHLKVTNLQFIEPHYRTGNVWLDEYIVEQDINLDDIIMQN